MRTHLILLGALLGCIALPSCSALGLDQIPVSDCTRQGIDGAAHNAFCASLAMTHPGADACHAWQCNARIRACELQQLDMDGDGSPAMMCAPPGVVPDCDDNDAHNAPTLTEVCDGRDNDCDGNVDEMAIDEHDTMLSTLTPVPEQTAFAVRGDVDEITLMARTASSYQTVLFGSTAPTSTQLTFMQSGTMPGLSVTDGALAATGRSGTPYALVVPHNGGGGCGQFALFPLAAGAPSATLRANDDWLVPTCPGAMSGAVGHPAVAGGPSGSAIVAWYPAVEDLRACGSAPEVPVVIGSGRIDQTALGHDRLDPAVTTLLNSVDYLPPTLLAVDDTHFLVAYPRADGSIPVHLIVVDASLHVTSHDIAYMEPGAAMPRGVTLALGATLTNGTSIGLAYHDGCSGTDPITVHLLTLRGTTLTSSAPPATGIGLGLTRRSLVLAYQPRASEWIVTWNASVHGVGVQRLSANGATNGMSFYIGSLASIPDGGTMPATRDYTVQALHAATAPLYRAVTYDGTNLGQVTFGCAATP